MSSCLSCTLNLSVIIQTSGSCQAVVRQSSGSRQAVVRQSSGSCQAVVRQSSGSRQAVIRQLSGSCQAVIVSCLPVIKIVISSLISKENQDKKMKSGLYSPDLSKCYFLQIHTKICSKVPMFYFNRPKRPPR